MISELDYPLTEQEVAEAIRQSSTAMNEYLSARKLLVDTGDDLLINSGALEEGVPVFWGGAGNEPDTITILPNRDYCTGETS
jgi:hypothetical protein